MSNDEFTKKVKFNENTKKNDGLSIKWRIIKTILIKYFNYNQVKSKNDIENIILSEIKNYKFIIEKKKLLYSIKEIFINIINKIKTKPNTVISIFYDGGGPSFGLSTEHLNYLIQIFKYYNEFMEIELKN